MVELMMAYSQAGTDVYANPVTMRSRAATLLSAARTPDFLFAIFSAAATMTIFWMFQHNAKLPNRVRSRLLQVGCISCAVVFLLVSQTVFYSGNWPTGTRYDFPGMLATPLMIVAVLDLVSTAVSLRWPRIRPSLLLLLAVMAFALPIRQGLNDIYEGSTSNVARTQSTKAKIAVIVHELKSSPTVPLILESHDPIDFELITSLKVFLKHFNVTNPIYVRVHGYTAETQSTGLFRELAASIIAWSKMDESEVAQAKHCYSVQFRGQGQTGCKTLAQF
jgi:hypothetical protein